MRNEKCSKRKNERERERERGREKQQQQQQQQYHRQEAADQQQEHWKHLRLTHLRFSKHVRRSHEGGLCAKLFALHVACLQQSRTLSLVCFLSTKTKEYNNKRNKMMSLLQNNSVRGGDDRNRVVFVHSNRVIVCYNFF